jgi:hypothetical protein
MPFTLPTFAHDTVPMAVPAYESLNYWLLTGA